MRHKLERAVLGRQRAIVASVIAVGVFASAAVGAAAVEGFADVAFYGTEATSDEPLSCTSSHDPLDGGGGGGDSGGC